MARSCFKKTKERKRKKNTVWQVNKWKVAVIIFILYVLAQMPSTRVVSLTGLTKARPFQCTHFHFNPLTSLTALQNLKWTLSFLFHQVLQNLLQQLIKHQIGMVSHTSNHNTQKQRQEGLCEFKDQPFYIVLRWLELYRQTLSQNNKTKEYNIGHTVAV